MEFYAHINKEQQTKQNLYTHLSNVAYLARQNLTPCGLQDAGELVGWLHDIGKYCTNFQEYLSGNTTAPIKHSFAGVTFLWKRYHETDNTPQKQWWCEILCAAIGSHHGLFDCVNSEGQSGFAKRISEADTNGYQEVIANMPSHLLHRIDMLFDASYTVFAQKIYPKIQSCNLLSQQRNFALISLALLTRLITSALMDADFSDTADFFGHNEEDFAPLYQTANQSLQHLEQTLERLPTDLPIHQARQFISQQCKNAATKSCTLFSLNTPTGSGKTLSTLRFALTRATCMPTCRLFFVSPLLTITEQTAQTIKDALGSYTAMIEHHSDIDNKTEVPNSKKEDVNQIEQYGRETWKAPVIVTTLAQWMNTLFAGKPSNIRRMQALQDSIIIIDEAQNVPVELLPCFNAVILFLTSLCNATIVLCSATIPCLDKVRHLSIPRAMIEEMVSINEIPLAVFDRTEIKYINECMDGKTLHDTVTNDELCQFMINALQRPNITSILNICNTRSDAAHLYTILKKHAAPNTKIYHLSAAMCSEHRRKILYEIKNSLAAKIPVICIATQVIEAGVDISFECVLRAEAGLDSVLQAAGRCNRNGEQTIANVYIYRPQNSNPPQFIQQTQNAFNSVYSSEQIIVATPEYTRQYYNTLYLNNNTCNKMLDLLTNNSTYNTAPSRIHQRMKAAFKTSGQTFNTYDNNSLTVVVPYDDTARSFIQLLNQKMPTKAQMRKMQKYCVSIYVNQKDKLANRNLIYPATHSGFYIATQYHPELGLFFEM